MSESRKNFAARPSNWLGCHRSTLPMTESWSHVYAGDSVVWWVELKIQWIEVALTNQKSRPEHVLPWFTKCGRP